MSDHLKYDLTLFGAAILATAAVLGANLDIATLLRIIAGLG